MKKIKEMTEDNLIIVSEVGAGKSVLVTKILHEKRTKRDFNLGILCPETQYEEYRNEMTEIKVKSIKKYNKYNLIEAIHSFSEAEIIVIDELRMNMLEQEGLVTTIEETLERDVQLILLTSDINVFEFLSKSINLKLVVGRINAYASNQFRQFKNINLYDFFYIDEYSGDNTLENLEPVI